MVMASQVLRTNSPTAVFENHRDLLSAISGVIFLGTPHRGSSFASLAGIQIWVGTRLMGVKSNDQIINVLMPDSPTLNELQKQYVKLCIDERMAGLQMVCFYEMRDLTVPGWFSSDLSRVVFEDSALLDAAIPRGMDADHVNMHNFYTGDGSGRRDPNYDLLYGDVRMMVRDGEAVVRARFEKWVYGSVAPDTEREQLQRWLGKPEARQAQLTAYDNSLKIQKSAPYTCKWIHITPEFRAWLSPDSELRTLWISGPAGSGKSVLTAYIINYLRNSPDLNGLESGASSSQVPRPDLLPIVLHFFCGPDRLSETPERMLSLLIHQLLICRPDNEKLVTMCRELYHTSLQLGVSASNYASSLKVMAQLFDEPLNIVIDNLEDTDHPKEFLDALAEVRDVDNIRILITSQQTGQIAKILAAKFDCPGPLLISDYSAEDIGHFIDARAEELLRENPVLQQKRAFIVDTVREKAGSIFQWVNSALQSLENVKDAADIEDNLNGVPKDLLTTYDKVFARLAAEDDSRTITRVQASLKFLAVAASPVRSSDIKMAYLVQEILSSVESMDKLDENALRKLFDLATSHDRMQTAEEEVRALLGALVEFFPDGTLQFKHGTWLKALTRPATTPTTSALADRFKFRMQDAHLAASNICMTICRVTTFAHANAFSEWQVPLVQYAWNAWAYHLQRSELQFQTVAELAQTSLLLMANPGLEPQFRKHMAQQELFDQMISSVCKDTLVYLDALIIFITRPLKAVPGKFSDREYIFSLQRAQESLGHPAKELCELRRLLNASISSSLQTSRAEVQQELDRPVPEQTLSMAFRQTKDQLRHVSSSLVGTDSFVRKLRVDEYLQDNPRIPRPKGGPKLLLELARALRTTTLRFSVDPIYSALLATAGGSSFSPLHPLVYLAQLLEEAGLYPYWKTIAPGRDPLTPFICPPTDREYPAAKFVLHCFEWRDPRVNESIASPTKTTGHYHPHYYQLGMQGPGGRPLPSRALTRVTTENWTQVQRLHEPKPEDHFTSIIKYRFFSDGDDSASTRFFFNPMANLHMKYKLMVGGDKDNNGLLLEQKDYSGRLMLFADPVEIMRMNEPAELQERPFKSWVRSLPAILRATFFMYMVEIMRKFGELAQRTFKMHFTRVELAQQDLTKARQFFTTMYHPTAITQSRLIYGMLAIVLFWVRCVYFPSWGSFIWFHSWSQFPYAYRHAALYIDLQNDFGFWTLMRDGFMYSMDWILGAAALFAIQIGPSLPLLELLEEQKQFYTKLIGENSILTSVCHVYACFHCLCAIERSLFSLSTTVASVVACSRLMFHDIDNVAAIFKFSIWLWVLLFFQILIVGIQRAAMERMQNPNARQIEDIGFGRWLMLFVGFPLLNFLAYVLFAIYIRPITRFLWAAAAPLRFVGGVLWTHVLMASMAALQIVGALAILLMVGFAYASMHKFIWDPYDTERSVRKLLDTSKKIHSTQSLPVAMFKRIGQFPFGGQMVTRQGTIEGVREQERGSNYGPKAAKAGQGTMGTPAQHGGIKEAKGAERLPQLKFGATQPGPLEPEGTIAKDWAVPTTAETHMQEQAKEPAAAVTTTANATDGATTTAEPEISPEELFQAFFGGRIPPELQPAGGYGHFNREMNQAVEAGRFREGAAQLAQTMKAAYARSMAQELEPRAGEVDGQGVSVRSQYASQFEGLAQQLDGKSAQQQQTAGTKQPGGMFWTDRCQNSLLEARDKIQGSLKEE
jgi:hypothetical protein